MSIILGRRGGGSISSGSASSGEVLTADGSGGATWEPAGGGSTLIGSDTAAGTVATLVVGSIPATFTHLTAYILGRSTIAGSNESCGIRLNASMTGHYGAAVLERSDNKLGANSDNGSSIPCGWLWGASGSSMFLPVVVQVPFYCLSGFARSIVSQGVLAGGGGGNQWTVSAAGSLDSTSAVTSLTVLPATASWQTGSRLLVYGH